MVISKDERLDQLFSEIQIRARNDDAGPPPYLFVGPKSDLKTLFGNEFYKTAPGKSGVPDTAYENAVNGSYWAAAQTGDIMLDHVKARTMGDCNMPIWHEYQRLIVPGALANGRPVFIAFTQHMRVFKEVAGTRQPHTD